MWKKIALGGAVAAAVIGAGTASMALTGDTSSTVSGTPAAATQASAAKVGGIGPLRRLARAHAVLHGSVVTKNPKTGAVVTHDVSHGTVTSVSATSITVQPADNTTQTFVVNSATKVRQRFGGKGSPSTISAVKNGDEVYVVGTGAGTETATAIVDIKK